MSNKKTESGLENAVNQAPNSNIQEQLAALQLEKMIREESERSAAAQQAEAYKQANLAQIRLAMLQKEQEQTFCNHIL